MWDAATRATAKPALPVVDRSDSEKRRFLFSLSIGEMFEIDDIEGGRTLCVVRKMRQDNQRLHYKSHTDARKADEIEADNLYLSPKKMRQLHARKVSVDAIGRIRFAND